jgi:hypothetical protein
MIMMQQRECRVCGQSFETRIEQQKRCPRCIDAENVRRGRQRSVVLERRVVQTFSNVVVVRLPAPWQSRARQTNTTHSEALLAYKIAFRGCDLNPASDARWSGRIDLFADRPYGMRQRCAVDIVEAKHAVSPDCVETHRYLRLRQPRLAELYDDDVEPLGLIWTVGDAPIVDTAAVWQQQLDSGGMLFGALLLTPTRAREIEEAAATTAYPA